jgi:hypothetical protein
MAGKIVFFSLAQEITQNRRQTAMSATTRAATGLHDPHGLRATPHLPTACCCRAPTQALTGLSRPDLLNITHLKGLHFADRTTGRVVCALTEAIRGFLARVRFGAQKKLCLLRKLFTYSAPRNCIPHFSRRSFPARRQERALADCFGSVQYTRPRCAIR